MTGFSRARRHVRAAVPAATVAAVASVLVLGGGAPAAAGRATATCSNSGTDSATIQAVINGSAPGDEIVIDGPCQITSTITLLGSRAYRGDSAFTTLTQAPGRNLAAVLASDSWVNNSSTTGEPISLRDLTVEANKAGNPTAGDGVVIRSWNTTIDNVRIFNARANGLRITNLSRNGTPLSNTQVNGSVRGVFVSGSDQRGIFVQDTGNSVTDWNLLDSWVAGSGGDAIRLDNTAGWNVERNHVYGVGGSGIEADRLWGASISDNYVEDFARNGIGIALQGGTGSTITGNRIFQFNGPGSTYLAINQVNYGTGQVAVTGNLVRGNGTGTGLSYQRGSNQLTVTSAGNSVTGVSTDRSVGAGVILTSGL